MPIPKAPRGSSFFTRSMAALRVPLGIPGIYDEEDL